MHDIIEFAGLGLGILGVIPLWSDKRKHLIATAVSVLVIVGAIFIFWERHEEHLEELERASRIDKIENQIMSEVCRSSDGVDFEEFLIVLDREDKWELVDEALGRVVDFNYVQVVHVSVPSWSGTGTVPMRVWKVKDRTRCNQS